MAAFVSSSSFDHSCRGGGSEFNGAEVERGISSKRVS